MSVPPINSAPSKTTPLAIALAILLVIPGVFVGGLAVVVYLFFTKLGLARAGGGSSWIPFLDGIFHIVWLLLIPEIIRGVVAVAGALLLSFLVFKRSSREIVTYTVVTVYLIVALALVAFDLFQNGFSERTFELAGFAAGIVGGGVTALQVQ